MAKRVVIQIAATDNNVYALCSDGTIWNWNCEGKWKEWPPVEEIPDVLINEKLYPIKPTPTPRKHGEPIHNG